MTMKNSYLQTTSFLLFAIIVQTILAIEAAEARPRKRRTTCTTKYKRTGIQHPLRQETAWQHLLRNGTVNEFVVALSVPRSLFFAELLPLFTSYCRTIHHGSPFKHSFSRRGRHAILFTVDVLGLGLWYLRFGDVTYSLCPVFGITPSSVSKWLKFSLNVLHNVVSDPQNRIFRIEWPSENEMKNSAAMLERHRPHGFALRGILAVTGGARMKVCNFEDPDTQNAYYNRYTQRVEVTNLLVWNFRGEIIHAAVNFPGSWHDSRLAYVSGLYLPPLREEEHTPPGNALLGDSAFASNIAAAKGKLVRARKVNETKWVPKSTGLVAVDLALQRLYPKERQSAEWGVRCLKAPFRRLSRTLPADHERRGRILSISCRLVSYRTLRVGYSQIGSVYSRCNLDDAVE